MLEKYNKNLENGLLNNLWIKKTTKPKTFKIQNNHVAKAEHKGKSRALYAFTKKPD